LEKNPENRGMPARAAAPMTNTTVVKGIFFRRPPMSKMSLLWTAWMTLPAARNSSALKKAWVPRWKYPANTFPAPSAAIM